MEYVIDGRKRELQKQKVRNEYKGNDVVHKDENSKQ